MRFLLPASLMLLSLLLPPEPCRAQVPDEAARLQGYLLRGDTTVFLFDAARYGVDAPQRVVVTGAFRGWSQDMDDPAWHLSLDGEPGLWMLAVPNPNLERIPPSTPFKFRIDEGRWLEPPAEAPNAEGGNLVFLQGVEPPRLRATLRSPRAVWATVTGTDRPLDAAVYRLTDHTGNEIPIAAVLPNTATETLVIPAADLDVRHIYWLEIPSEKLRAWCSFDGWFQHLYSDKPLGANVSDDGTTTTFRLFAPRADAVRLYLYDGPDDARAYRIVEMQRDAQGVWEAFLDGDLHGTYYDFTVHGTEAGGDFYFEQTGRHVTDPYARVSVDSFGRTRVWRRTQPATPLAGGRPKMEDVVAYEMHVQDFTDQLPVPDDLKGTIPAMTLPGLRNSRGEKIGFDYLVDLGVNVVHLMPMQEFLHYPDDEWRAAFADDPYMIAQGISDENYQWGYRITHFFAVESRYRRKGTEHGAQREQFRDLIQAFHDHGIAVIVDFVFNHTGENMDGRHYLFNFNGIDPLYYYRTRDLRRVGEYGNETKSENRPMVQRWIIDQCRHFIEEFGVDGFRIDLAGQTDEQTLRALKAALPDDVIIYGEPWIGSADPDYEANPDWDWYKEDAPITFFQDDARNAFKGPVSNPRDKRTDRGFAGGNTAERERVKLALTNGFPEEIDPNRGINYLDIHDNWALADQFALHDWDGRLGVDEGPFKIAATLLFTSLGPIVLHGGTEMMRSKGHAPLEERVKETASGPLAFHGKRDTYNLRRANQFVWENVGRTKGDAGSHNDYRGMLAYWKGLIALRLGPHGAVFRIGRQPPEDYYRWIEPEDAHLLGYIVDERVLVLVNTATHAATFTGVDLPAGSWRLVADGQQVDPNGLEGRRSHITGGRSHDIRVPATTAMIWVRE